MRKYIVPFSLGLIFLILGVYLLRILSPLNAEVLGPLISAQKITTDAEFLALLDELVSKGIIWDYLDLRNVAIIAGIFFVAVSSLFAAAHLTLARVFFLKFYEQPHLIAAIRRGVEFGVFLLSAVVIRLYGLEIYYWGLVGVLLICLEYLIWKTVEKPLSDEEREQKTLFQLSVVRFRGTLRDLRASASRTIRRKSSADLP
ncbi:MAG: hypothetical protein JNK26_00055 [Candidatus Doudnabacteria bacterium]|nr:hypothetical protein [Candidatus Doudnabacteria bacterium]